MNAFTDQRNLRAAPAVHPTVPAGSERLLSAHEHSGMLLDLYGHRDGGKAYVWYVALPGDQRDLSMAFNDSDFDAFNAACDAEAVNAYAE